eukprot:TRINITY_DN11232_c0_g1_i2.p1 TRINITY_DN11232_c0_g1~~TRINITY_DN11232_c0_g1_i2.p1  ORF type:complete len:465 (+),score=90.60 TRINITY_DN11232_c0_g1_i2:79-1473(+)
MSAFQEGDHVYLCGMVGRAHLNGLRGSVALNVDGTMVDSETRRLRVRVQGTPYFVKAEMSNLRPTSRQEDPTKAVPRLARGMKMLQDEASWKPASTDMLDSGTTPPPLSTSSTKAATALRTAPLQCTNRRYQMCGATYAGIKATRAGRDPRRLRNLGLSTFRDDAGVDNDHPASSVMKHWGRQCHTARERYDWRRDKPCYVAPDDIPMEQGGTGPSEVVLRRKKEAEAAGDYSGHCSASSSTSSFGARSSPRKKNRSVKRASGDDLSLDSNYLGTIGEKSTWSDASDYSAKGRYSSEGLAGSAGAYAYASGGSTASSMESLVHPKLLQLLNRRSDGGAEMQATDGHKPSGSDQTSMGAIRELAATMRTCKKDAVVAPPVLRSDDASELELFDGFGTFAPEQGEARTVAEELAELGSVPLAQMKSPKAVDSLATTASSWGFQDMRLCSSRDGRGISVGEEDHEAQ